MSQGCLINTHRTPAALLLWPHQHVYCYILPWPCRYGSDITCTWPANGTFTQQQALVYNAVLDAHDSVVAAMAPGVSWHDMQVRSIPGLLPAVRGCVVPGGLVLLGRLC